MKRWTQFALALVATLSMACGGGNDRANDRAAAPAGGTAGAAGTAGSAGAPDADFIQDQLADGDAEVALGRLVQERATNPQVKEFGEMMVQDHQKAGAELKQIAGKHNITVEGKEANEHNDAREKLSKLSGAEFDREYMKTMVDDHEKAVNDVERKAENADNPEVRQWASKSLPTLRQHLERARQIQETLEKGDSGAGARKPGDR
jgi:putative membrane protein